MQQILLPSGRGVRLQTLDYEQVDNVEISVAGSDKMQAGKGIVSAMQFTRLCSVEGIGLMVVEMTETAGLTTLDGAKWLKCSPAMFTDKLKTFFSAKDIVILRNRYSNEHDLTPQEVAEVLEKKVDVLPG